MPAPTKKWMVVLNETQYDWIKETAEKADVSGATVLRALITDAMSVNSAEFRRNLMSSQLRSELAALEVKQIEITEKAKELRMKLSGKERIPV